MPDTDRVDLSAVDEFIQLNDRVEIFRHLTVDQLDSEVNDAIFRGLLDTYYPQFAAFCDEIRDNPEREKIRDISCHIADKQIYFDVRRDP